MGVQNLPRFLGTLILTFFVWHRDALFNFSRIFTTM